MADNEYISAIIADETGKTPLYYGKILKPATADGKLSLQIPAGATGKYTIKLFNEQCNGDKETDYASSFVDMPLTIHTHNWEAATYEWSADGTKCTASRHCTVDGGHTVTAEGHVEKIVSKEATCENTGSATCSATFDEKWATTQSGHEIVIPVKDHDWTVTYEWGENCATCIAKGVCKYNPSHTISAEAKITSQITQEPTDVEMGKTTYTAIFEGADWAKTQTKTLTNIPTLKGVIIKGIPREVKFAGKSFDINNLNMFEIDPNAGAPTYSIVEGGTGSASIDGTNITVNKAGTIEIKVKTARKGEYASGQATATLTVNKGVGEGSVALDGWTYGEAANNPTSTSSTNKGASVTYLYESTDGKGYSNAEAPTNAGAYKVTATFAETDLYEPVTAVANFNIAKAELVSNVNETEMNIPYNGTAQGPADIKEKITAKNNQTITIKYGTKNGNYELTEAPKFTNVGTYVVYFKATAPNHNDLTGSYKVVISKQTSVNAPNAPAQATAITNSSVTLKAVTVAAGYTVEYACRKAIDKETPLVWQDGLEFTNLEANTAYNFYARIKGTNNNNESPASTALEVTTSKTSLVGAEVKANGEYIYNGTAQVPESVTVTLNGKTVPVGQYDISATNNINAGTATVTVTGKDKYEGTATGEFTIAPKTVSVESVTLTNRDYDAENKNAKAEAIAFTGNPESPLPELKDVTIVATLDNNDPGVDKVVKVKVTLNNNNYTFNVDGQNTNVANIAGKVTINKLAKDALTIEGKAKYDAVGTVDLTELLKQNGIVEPSFTVKTATQNGEYLDGDCTVENNIFKFKFKTTAENVAKTVVVPVTVTSKYYKDFDINVTLTVLDKQKQKEIKITGIKDFKYKEAITLNVEGGSGDGEVRFEIIEGLGSVIDTPASNVVKDGKINLTGLKAGTFKIKVNKAETADYVGVESIVYTVKIVPIDATGTPDFTEVDKAGVKLSEVALKDTNMTPKGGVFTWNVENPETVDVEQGKSYEWTYTPQGEDANNYNPITGKVVLYPAPPERVKNVKVKTDNGLLKVTFGKVAGADSYRVYVKEVGAKGGFRWYYGNSEGTMIKWIYKKPLVKNGKYQIKVAALNEIGRGDYTVAKTVFANRIGTKSAKMYTPKIVSITFSKTNTKTAKVYVKNTPKKLQYKVSYKLKGTKAWKSAGYSAKNVKYIKGLKKGRVYNFALRYRYQSSLDGKTYVYSTVAYRAAKVR